MNVDNILRAADAIEQHSIPDLGFNMMTYFRQADSDVPDKSGHNCGTVACIAGWVAHLLGEKEGLEFSTARDYFGIDDYDADHLFEPDTDVVDYDSVTPAMACRTLRHLAATGEVRWDLPKEGLV